MMDVNEVVSAPAEASVKVQNLSSTVKISYQIGSQFGGNAGLLWSLRRNLPVLAEAGVLVPRPRYYRNVIIEGSQGSQEDHETTEIQDQLAYSGLQEGENRLVFFSDTNLMAPPNNLWDGIRWFPDIGAKAAQVRALFPDAEMQFFIELCSPESLLSSIISSESAPDFSGRAGVPDPFLLSWRDVLEDIRNHVPDAPVTTWCAEELPFVWGKVMHMAAGLPDEVELEGELDPLEGVMTDDGLKRLRSYLKSRPDFPEEVRARVTSIFIEKFVPEDVLENELAIPDWTQDRQKLMEEYYTRDVQAAAGTDGVEFVTI